MTEESDQPDKDWGPEVLVELKRIRDEQLRESGFEAETSSTETLDSPFPSDWTTAERARVKELVKAERINREEGAPNICQALSEEFGRQVEVRDMRAIMIKIGEEKQERKPEKDLVAESSKAEGKTRGEAENKKRDFREAARRMYKGAY